MVVVVMGVAGSGKSTVGRLLAEHLVASFFDADDFHPRENVAKMASGRPLTDEDRLPWLTRLNGLLVDCQAADTSAVLACSALKASYRRLLSEGVGDIRFVYLKGDYETIFNRMTLREGHFMGEGMLRSQFDALEEPTDAIAVDIEESPDAIVARVMAQLRNGRRR